MATIEQLKAKVEAARAYKQAADITCARAEAELAEASGNEESARFLSLYADAQEGKPGAHDAFMAFSAEQKARRVLLGETKLDDYSAFERPAIVRAMSGMHLVAGGSGATP